MQGRYYYCEVYRERYQALYYRQFIRIETKRKSDEMITDSVTEQQEAAGQRFHQHVGNS